MGKYYNAGWSVGKTNILVDAIRRHFPDYPIHKKSLMYLVKFVQLHSARYRNIDTWGAAEINAQRMEELRRDYPALNQIRPEKFTLSELKHIDNLPI